MMTRWNRSVAAGTGVVCAFLWSSAALADAPDAASPHGPGVWQKHQLAFQYLGFTSTYSCDGLADVLKILLRAAGARSDAKSQPGACAAPFGRPDKFARADLTFYTLVPAGNDATNTAAADSKPVDGVWRKVSLARYSPRELRIGDCEVVEQFRNLVLPMFTTRNLENHTTCIPFQESGTLIDLRFESFTAAAPPRHGRPSADRDGGAGSAPAGSAPVAQPPVAQP
jgi:hypothetical protein